MLKSKTSTSKLLGATALMTAFLSVHMSLNAAPTPVLTLVPIPVPVPLPTQDLTQEPPTNSITSAANVMLIMDDSSSMMGVQLPGPVGFNYAGLSFTGQRLFPNRQGGTTYLPSVEIVYRNSEFNPMWYNPAITYRPWNDNNKPPVSNFPNSSLGTIDATNTVIDATRDDMRFRTTGGVKDEVSLTTTDLFRRYGTRQGPNCLSTVIIPSTTTTCSAYGPPVYTPVPNSESGQSVSSSCIGTVTSTTTNVSVCSAFDTLPQLVIAHYLAYEGNATQRDDPSKYRLVEIDRDSPSQLYPTPTNPATGAAIERLDCLNPIQCTFTEEAQNFANYWTYYRNRLFAAIAVTSQVLTEIDEKTRIGYGRLNYFPDGPEAWPGLPATKPPATLPDIDGKPNPGHVVRGVRPFLIGSTERQELFTWLFGLNGVGGTPNREAIDASGKYFSRPDERGPWAFNPGTGDPVGTVQLSCRRNFAILATDGTWTDSPNHPRISTLYPGSPALSPAQSDAVDSVPINGDGKQAGKVYQYTAATNLPLGGTLATQDQTLTDVTFSYWSRDLRPDLPNVIRPIPWPDVSGLQYPKDFANPATWQNMSTYIVGYGLNPSISLASAKTAMQDGTAIAWPAVDILNAEDGRKIDETMRAALASRGDFFTAKTPAGLASSLKQVFASIGSSQGSASSIAVSSSIITSNADLVFVASYNSTNWSGSLRAIKANQYLQGIQTGEWDATLPTDYTTRNLYTSTAINTPVTMSWGSLTPAQKGSIGTLNRFKYLIGDQSLELPVGTFRIRAPLLGSIIHAGPIHSKATNFGYQFLSGTPGATYAAWLNTKRTTRRSVVLVGANSGMLHGFDAADGKELFGFTPRAAIGSMNYLSDPAYEHRYLVDGVITEGDVYSGGAWKTYALGSGGAGPKSLFMLDITNPAAFDASKVLFDLTGADEPDLGHVLGGGVIAPTRSGQWVAIVGNGYESTSGQSGVLIFDVNTGALIRKLMTGIGSNVTGLRNGMGPVTPVFDAQRNVIGLYAGDKYGNLWKIDMTAAVPADWKFANTSAGLQTGPVMTPLFIAKDLVGVAQPITTAPRVTQHPEGGIYVAFGTGKVFDKNDVTDKQLQTVYGIRDEPNSGPWNRSNLLNGTLSLNVDGNRELTGLTGPAGLDWAVHKGWMINLSVGGSKGERVVASPRISGGMLTLGTYDPETFDVCEPGGKSYVYQLDLASNFKRAGFKNQSALVVATAAQDGLTAALASLFTPGTTNGVQKSSITSAELQLEAKNARYRIDGLNLTDVSPSSACALSGNSISNLSVIVPTACSGTTPLRVWRDLK